MFMCFLKSSPRNLFAAFLFVMFTTGRLHAQDASSPAAKEVFSLPDKYSPETAWWRDSMKTHDERIEWWREARFGMFIHWGVYSELGNEYRGRKGGTYAEHIQRVLKIPIPEYRAEVAGNFNPTNFDADAWVRLAKDAGMGYMVITAKHHDGFAMWPTKVNDYNIMDATPWKHDPMADLSAACKKYGVKFGFYYSQAFDWGNSNAPGNDWEYKNPGGDTHIGGINWWETKPEFMASARRYVDTKAIPQLRELIRLYHPAILWFDTAGKLPPSENLRIMRAVRAADPNVVISGRLVRGWGDYDDTTDRPAEFPAHAGDWEGIPTTDESYGWNKFDQSHKPPGHFIQLLAKAAARGGNVLMNIGPMGDGNIDPKDVAILKGIADWWRVNGASIRGTTRTPLAVQSWGESTRKGGTLFLHVFRWPTNGELVVGGLKTDVKRAWLLSDTEKHPLAISRLDPLDVKIAVPNSAPDKVDSMVVVECAGEMETDTNRLLQAGFSTETLRTFDGTLHGKLKYGAGKKTDAYVENWTAMNEFISWPVRLTASATYEVSVIYDAEEGSAGNVFTVTAGGKDLRGSVTVGKEISTAIGRLHLDAGISEIRLTSEKITSGELMRPRSLVLTRVE
jgi:alpha-L-fucosidase